MAASTVLRGSRFVADSIEFQSCQIDSIDVPANTELSEDEDAERMRDCMRNSTV